LTLDQPCHERKIKLLHVVLLGHVHQPGQLFSALLKKLGIKARVDPVFFPVLVIDRAQRRAERRRFFNMFEMRIIKHALEQGIDVARVA